MQKISLLAALGVAAAAVSAGAVVAEPLRIAHSTWVGYGPLHLADELGYLREEGVEVTFNQIEEKAIQMAGLMGGRLDAIATGVDAVIPYANPGACFRYILALDESYGGDGLVATKDIETLQDLRGKNVAFNEGGISHFWLSSILAKEGMSIQDVQAVNMTPDNAAAAFMAGQVDAAVTWEPHLTAASGSQHGRVVMTSAATPGYLADAIVVPCDVLEERGDELGALVRGWFRAVEYYEQNPEAATEIMAARIGGYLKDPKEFTAALQGARFYDRERSAEYFGTEEESGDIQAVLDAATAFWSQQGKVDSSIKVEELVDRRFIR